ncbi:DNA-binding protein [Methylorubrum thiocyanatum]|uniref:Uncharacterized small protein (DUF1192 family) n=1 Tax=Methylorubrum thiocyanatum TaxID=47958 RepID=A0AA40S4V8_9HYPH|nr:DNA-binding protein [Methylorubrum thiocyanatum]MBA8914603.1 uncharacterized small protein (DUF1192 family) [Methylorubrum thiocyanatum]GJE81984.1 hypothetical protein CJNNKLLH_3341 [Methylorubrum thiocyanatum]
MAGMVGVNDVFHAANLIRARPAPPGGVKERVSVRNVRKQLGGGSFGDIARALRKWREDEDYRPAIEQADLPEAFERRVVGIGRELLEMARVEATRARLADFVEAEERRALERDVLDEALERVDRLEERIETLQAELDRWRSGSAMPVVPAMPEPAPATKEGLIDAAFGRKLASEADGFWDAMRDAVEAVVRRKGPMAVHPLFKALPEALKRQGEVLGFPLTPAWLRYHLLRIAEDGNGLSQVGYRFGLAEPEDAGAAAEPKPGVGDDVAAMGSREFWRRFVHEVHDRLSKEGPLTVEAILDGMGSEWVEASARFQRITPGRLRYKLRGRIVEGRPFEALEDGRFAALAVEGHWDGRSATAGSSRGGDRSA